MVWFVQQNEIIRFLGVIIVLHFSKKSPSSLSDEHLTICQRSKRPFVSTHSISFPYTKIPNSYRSGNSTGIKLLRQLLLVQDPTILSIDLEF